MSVRFYTTVIVEGETVPPDLTPEEDRLLARLIKKKKAHMVAVLGVLKKELAALDDYALDFQI